MVSVQRKRHPSSDDGLPLRQTPPLPRLGEQPLREVEPLCELAHLRLEAEHAILEVRHTTVRRTRPDDGIGDFPPRYALPIAVTEVSRGDDDDVVEVPDPHPAESEAHPDAALGAADVEAVQSEPAAHDRQPERHAARALRHRPPRRAWLRWLHRLVARQ